MVLSVFQVIQTARQIGNRMKYARFGVGQLRVAGVKFLHAPQQRFDFFARGDGEQIAVGGARPGAVEARPNK